MQKLNEFITNNQADLQRFFDDILVSQSLSPLLASLNSVDFEGSIELDTFAHCDSRTGEEECACGYL